MVTAEKLRKERLRYMVWRCRCGALVERVQLKARLLLPITAGFVCRDVVIDSTGQQRYSVARGRMKSTANADTVEVQGTGLPPRALGQDTPHDYSFADDGDLLDAGECIYLPKRFQRQLCMAQLIDTRDEGVSSGGL